MFRYIYALLVSFFLCSLGALAYGQDAQVQGQVADTAGAAISKALVRVVDQRTGTERKSETNTSGQYTVPGLTPGAYMIYAQAPGFGAAVSDAITLNSGQSAVMDFTLKVGGTSADVVVTAEKRDEHLQDVPMSISVLDTEQLVDTGKVHLTDYYSSVPGLTLEPGAFGGLNLQIRGITTNQSNPTVGITVDDLPFGGSTDQTAGQFVPDIDPGDLERIEVLKGPQGTLYGANSMGGLIKYVTKDPSTEGVSGRVETGTSGVNNGAEPGYMLRGSVNIPLTRTLAIRASGFKRQDPGYIDNPVLNIKGVNEAQGYAGRWAAQWQPISTLTLKLSALYQNTNQNGLSEAVVQSGLGSLQQNYILGAGKSETTLQAYSAALKYKFGNVDLASFTGYNLDRSHKSADYSDGFFGQAIQSTFGVSGALFDFNDNTQRISQEARLTGSLWKHTDWLVGGFYSHERDPRTAPMYAENSVTGQIVGLYYDFYYINPPTFDDYAGFGNVTFHVTDQFDVQVGGRESHDRLVVGENVTAGPYADQYIPGGSPSLAPATASSSNTFTYLVTPRFKLSSNSMVYSRFASGYRPGAPNGQLQGLPSESQPDKTETYEIGTKNDFFNHHFDVDASLYYINWSNIQLQLTSGQGIAYVTNGSGAKSEGVELAATARPLTGLTFSGWGNYDDAALTQTFPVGTSAYGTAGDRLPYSSRWSGNVSGNQNFRLRAAATGFVNGTVSYIGDRVGIFEPTALRQIYPSYAKVDLNAGVRYSTWIANIYANNVADKRGILGGGIGYTPSNAFIYIQPRTVGISLSKYF